MKYTNLCKLYYLVFSKILRESISEQYGNEYTKSLLKKAESEYKNMIARASSTGGKENPMSSNLYQGMVFLAIYKSAAGKIPANEMKKMVINALKHSKIVKLATQNINRQSDKYREWIHKTACWTQKNAERYPMNWIMRENLTADKPGTYYEYTRCALYELCKMEKCPEIAPMFCAMDYVTAHFGKSKLIRKGSLAQGAPFCDFCYVEEDE